MSGVVGGVVLDFKSRAKFDAFVPVASWRHADPFAEATETEKPVVHFLQGQTPHHLRRRSPKVLEGEVRLHSSSTPTTAAPAAMMSSLANAAAALRLMLLPYPSERHADAGSSSNSEHVGALIFKGECIGSSPLIYNGHVVSAPLARVVAYISTLSLPRTHFALSHDLHPIPSTVHYPLSCASSSPPDCFTQASRPAYPGNIFTTVVGE